MFKLNLKGMSLSVDFEAGQIASLIIGERERIASRSPLFTFLARDVDGNEILASAYDSCTCKITENGAVYSNFKVEKLKDTVVRVTLESKNGEAVWGISIAPASAETVIEWVEFPFAVLPKLKENNPSNDGGEILYPYNEGAIVSNNDFRDASYFPHLDMKYPSMGCYSAFPYMNSSQLISYLWESCGLYIGAHDKAGAVKGISFYPYGEGIGIQLRLYCGVEFGQAYVCDFPIVWAAIDGNWQSAAERYREWFYGDIGVNLTKTLDDKALPEWYASSPLVISYPVRGIHDMDEMKPNALFPYTNALPLINEVKQATDARILVALMHWEGTAPWAPPYVWPPYGGVDAFNEFKDALHSQGDMLGVYCSGFGYTKQSNLIAEYNCEKDYIERGLDKAMCASPKGKVEISNICTGQRSGYDICAASELGKEILKEAYIPLFESGIDYAQILDQNHGGSQYFCYSRKHGHPPVPGKWMAENMKKVLSEWNKLAPNMLFGCESAAAEPYISKLRFSDNRFELNYMGGKAVPLYSYIYHEYLRNFMGNQVCCPLESSAKTLCYRLAYSYAAGDSMTLVFAPDGRLMSNWGTRDFDHAPEKEPVYTLIRNLTKLYKEKMHEYLLGGKMIKGGALECGEVIFKSSNPTRALQLPEILSSAWALGDKRVQLLVNPSERDIVCTLNGKKITVPALNGVALEI